jgi:hypothetical protein
MTAAGAGAGVVIIAVSIADAPVSAAFLSVHPASASTTSAGIRANPTARDTSHPS